jgi:hypothetical protein
LRKKGKEKNISCAQLLLPLSFRFSFRRKFRDKLENHKLARNVPRESFVGRVNLLPFFSGQFLDEEARCCSQLITPRPF